MSLWSFSYLHNSLNWDIVGWLQLGQRSSLYWLFYSVFVKLNLQEGSNDLEFVREFQTFF